MKKELSVEKLIEMQTLCHQVEEDANKISEFITFIQEANKRRKMLADFYQNGWMFYFEDEENQDKWDKALEAHIVKGSYSILGEDTIWDALFDGRMEILELLKTIVPMID